MAYPPKQSNSGSPYSVKDEKSLMTEIWDPEIAENPYKFVMFVFPWGKANTPLAAHKGPKNWQRDDLEAIADHIRSNKARISAGVEPQVYREATSSGRGPGKSAKLGWLSYWNMSCNLGSSTIITANSETQLKTKTMAELGKWHTLAINSHWFERQTMALHPTQWFKDALRKQLKIDTGYYYAQAQLWSAEDPDSFAGAHNPHGMLVEYDEASGIPAPIWQVTEGFFTEPVLHRYWVVNSNPRKNTGPFFECFHKNRAFWLYKSIDARKVEGAALDVLNGIIAQYGEDSDEARVEVKGEFPKQGDDQLISRETVQQAAARPMPDPPDNYAPLIMGVDVGRGGDPSVIRWRRGRDARSIPRRENKARDNMAVAHWVADWIEKTDPDAVCIDAGAGTGVIDKLRELKYRVHEIWFGGKTLDPGYFDLRTSIWVRMADWLPGACIDASTGLEDDLAGPEKQYVGHDGITKLESKDDMKKRGLASPNDGDALALTFSVRVARRDRQAMGRRRRPPIAPGTNYDIFGTRR